MKDLIEILDYVRKSTSILLVAESKSLSEYFFDYIYNNYDSRKSKISTNKHLKYRAIFTKDKLLGINIFFDKIQLDSNNSYVKKRSTLLQIKQEMYSNNSKILFKGKFTDADFINVFDLYIIIYNDKMHIHFGYDTIEFYLEPKIIRKIKLSKIQQQFL